MRKAPKGGKLHPLDGRINRIIAMVRAKAEHPSRVIKRQLGHMKTRCRGLAKNRAQLFTPFALAAGHRPSEPVDPVEVEPCQPLGPALAAQDRGHPADALAVSSVEVVHPSRSWKGA